MSFDGSSLRPWQSGPMADDEAADEGPISVPYEEPSEDEQERLRKQSELSDLISAVCGQLQHEVAAVQHAASITASAPESATRDEMGGLAGQCSGLSAKGYAAAAQLQGAGVEDWVYSVKACNEVGFWANSAAGHANAAAASESDSEIRSSLDQVVNELGNAASSIGGA